MSVTINLNPSGNPICEERVESVGGSLVEIKLGNREGICDCGSGGGEQLCSCSDLPDILYWSWTTNDQPQQPNVNFGEWGQEELVRNPLVPTRWESTTSNVNVNCTGDGNEIVLTRVINQQPVAFQQAAGCDCRPLAHYWGSSGVKETITETRCSNSRMPARWLGQFVCDCPPCVGNAWKKMTLDVGGGFFEWYSLNMPRDSGGSRWAGGAITQYGQTIIPILPGVTFNSFGQPKNWRTHIACIPNCEKAGSQTIDSFTLVISWQSLDFDPAKSATYSYHLGADNTPNPWNPCGGKEEWIIIPFVNLNNSPPNPPTAEDMTAIFSIEPECPF